MDFDMFIDACESFFELPQGAREALHRVSHDAVAGSVTLSDLDPDDVDTALQWLQDKLDLAIVRYIGITLFVGRNLLINHLATIRY